MLRHPASLRAGQYILLVPAFVACDSWLAAETGVTEILTVDIPDFFTLSPATRQSIYFAVNGKFCYAVALFGITPRTKYVDNR
jgi:hypothetical protein